MLIASAGLELGYVLLLIFSATEYLYWPWGLWSANLISTSLLISISLVQVLAFSLPLAKPRTSSKQGHNSFILTHSIGSTKSEGSTKSTGQTPSSPSLNMDTIVSARTNPNMSFAPSTARSERMASGDDDVEQGKSVEMTSPKVDLIIEESPESEENDSEESSESEISEDNDSEDSSDDE